MKPFSAWLAMRLTGEPSLSVIDSDDGSFLGYTAFRNARAADRTSAGEPQRVLITEDTAENRRKLGLEE